MRGTGSDLQELLVRLSIVIKGFQQNLLNASSALPQADLLREELRQFERKSQRGGASKLGASSGHDDLVMALALAGWWAYENKSRALSGPELKALDY